MNPQQTMETWNNLIKAGEYRQADYLLAQVRGYRLTTDGGVHENERTLVLLHNNLMVARTRVHVASTQDFVDKTGFRFPAFPILDAQEVDAFVDRHTPHFTTCFVDAHGLHLEQQGQVLAENQQDQIVDRCRAYLMERLGMNVKETA